MTVLHRLLRPRSIAVLGSVWAENVIIQCQKMGFDGPVWPVHPTKPIVGGLDAYAGLSDLPEPPDATFIGVNRHITVDVVRELSAMGAGGAICFASGWTEAGQAGLQADLVAAAGAMPILGPNCYGLINYLDGALLWPDQHGGRRVARGVALLSQSSNIVINLTMQARGLPVAYVACLGNAAQVGLADLAAALLADERVTALGLYVEGIDNAAEFAALAEVSRSAGKAIVCLKSGKTEASQAAAASHTASLAGGGVASSAFLRQAGVAEVSTLPQLLEALKIAHVHGPQIGRRLCSLSCSGGEAGLVADLGAATGIGFLPPSAQQRQRLGEILGPIVTISNPLDYHTFIWGDGPRTTDVFATMLGGYDAGIFIIDPPRQDRCDPSSFQPALDAIEAAAALTGKPAFPVSSLPENFDERLVDAMMARGTVPLLGLDTALAALVAAQTPPGRAGWRPISTRRAPDLMMLDEVAAKALLATAGVTVPNGVQAEDLPGLSRQIGRLALPFALKGLGFAHKSENGAVRLGLHSLDGEAAMPGATGYLAEEMVQGVIAELLLGLRRDPVYGVTMTMGFGGVTAELLADTVTLICPVVADEVETALRGLRLWPLLDGYRGRLRGDAAAAVAAALQVQAMMQDVALEEVEINPLMVLEHGVVAVDAVIWKEAI
ncbi:acetate--CoA ligase family protein [Pseudorhodobacter sp.]|uniref:acetate--CoA ligase family protein n=1 Tax=Pseudorhodobacter sp. TaxID=1934400 RepID=UPI00264882E8|nr:acetate--CoA ligase family protein [Pseudorhodobacter sp.]MDN5787670.1 acetate--CoA ligase family protein [Pseudorhodobacter sp.]